MAPSADPAAKVGEKFGAGQNYFSRQDDDQDQVHYHPPPVPRDSSMIGTVDVRHTLAQRRRSALAGRAGPSGDLEKTVEEADEEAAAELLSSATRKHYSWEIDPKKLVLKKYIAGGAYGEVHRGTFDGMDVAVKLLDWGADDGAARAELLLLREAFIHEVSVWSTLQHRNVTQFIGAIVGGAEGFHIPTTSSAHNGHVLVDGHVSCVVLEFVPGGTLKDFLVQHLHKKLPMKSVIQLSVDIASGLAYLHEKRIVHRDVKSENMLLDKQKTVKIADFGVSRVENDSRKTMCQLAGTYGYMAPEVLMGIPYDHKVDVYSYGILLWEIYCCEDPFPFHEFNAKDIKGLVSQGLRPDIPNCCPKSLASIMTRCWDKDPDKRPNMDEVVVLLKKVDTRSGAMKPTTADEVSKLAADQPGCGCGFRGLLKKLTTA